MLFESPRSRMYCKASSVTLSMGVLSMVRASLRYIYLIGREEIL
jgi:hypothetical protein